ncbi:MAG: hypothetical protein GKR86_10505, partial [Ilumatobacter sp.]|nr:hypothetical protein [Ilumatobacter sp.]
MWRTTATMVSAVARIRSAWRGCARSHRIGIGRRHFIVVARAITSVTVPRRDVLPVRLGADVSYAQRLMVCVSCSQPLPEGARFCSFCGHEVRSNAVEERRVVTVLFADLVGYTALSEHVDPERVKRVVEGAFQPLIDQIERFGGRVDKVLGDGILALFGAPVAHEDDPDRAIRAAIEMHAALDGYVGEVGLDQQLQL